MMEKGSFHTSDVSIPKATSRVQQLDEVVKRIPLPNQLPKGLDFANIPAPALRSATLESLISQNEDLMARLNVALRKTNQLEERTTVLDRENAVLRGRIDAVQEQYIILQEKDRRATERAQQLHDDAGTSKMAAEKLERLYADLYLQAIKFQLRMAHLERHRARILKVAKNLQKRANRLPSLESGLKSLQVTHTQSVSSYEAKLNEARLQMDEFRVKASERDQMFEQRMQIENKLVFEQRQTQIYRADAQRELDRLDQECTSLRQQLKTALVQDESKRQELERLTHELPDLQQEQRALREQVESLQTLWAHKQQEMEQLEEKNRNLQRLNQSLSATLNQQRKETEIVRLEMDKEAFTAHEKFRALNTEIEMLRHQLAKPEFSLTKI